LALLQPLFIFVNVEITSPIGGWIAGLQIDSVKYSTLLRRNILCISAKHNTSKYVDIKEPRKSELQQTKFYWCHLDFYTTVIRPTIEVFSKHFLTQAQAQ